MRHQDANYQSELHHFCLHVSMETMCPLRCHGLTRLQQMHQCELNRTLSKMCLSTFVCMLICVCICHKPLLENKEAIFAIA